MIRLTKVADYGIVLLSYVAQEYAGEKFSARELSEETQIPAPMVSKILKELQRNGLLESHRGVNGGYTLASPAQEISVADVVRALDGPIALTECVEVTASDCTIEAVCPVKSNWQRINDAVEEALGNIRISEMTPPFCGRHSQAEQSLSIALPREHNEPQLVR